MDFSRLAVRWTIGDVGPRGFESLRLSIAGAWACFGPAASYLVCVNTLDPAAVRARVGPVPAPVAWRPPGALPDFLRDRLGPGMAEGVAWKFAPPRCFPDRFELSLDNDCILWSVPEAVRRWLAKADPRTCVLAEDVRPAFGRFAPLCGDAPRNTGIRGLPPGYDLGAALQAMLERHDGPLLSELDEQGLQVAALSDPPALAVTLDEVTICSPFWPHRPDLGRCGAHFVGLNTRHIAWDYYGRPADDWMTGHWRRHRPALYRRVGLEAP